MLFIAKREDFFCSPHETSRYKVVGKSGAGGGPTSTGGVSSIFFAFRPLCSSSCFPDTSPSLIREENIVDVNGLCCSLEESKFAKSRNVQLSPHTACLIPCATQRGNSSMVILSGVQLVLVSYPRLHN